jgi:flagellar motility protein MotE (MotC chaperone)
LATGRTTCAAAIGAALLSLPLAPIASSQQPWDALVSPAVKPARALPEAVPPKAQAEAAVAKALPEAIPPKALPEVKALPKAAPKPKLQARQAKTPAIAVPLPIEERLGAPATAVAAPPPPSEIETGAAEQKPAREYCASIADAAADARVAWQKKTLADLDIEIGKRIALLEAKTEEFRQWVVRRDAFSKKAHDGLIRIYARMRPDAAAMQLANIDEETAASLLTKLEPRNASAILGEMEPAKAARLTATISGAAKVPPPAPPKPQDKPS